jgi:nucleoside-diphosphate-sugar epimerase
MTFRKIIFLTGITGNIGALAALRFLEAGHRVYAVVRSRGDDDTYVRRVKRCFSALGAETDWPNLTLIKADITDGDEMGLVELPEPITESWHFASSLKYMPKDREEIYAANVTGLRNVIALHQRARAGDDAMFYYISTAYVGGKSHASVPEARIRITEESAFHNNYESSKLEAENIVFDECEAGRLKMAIFRPSIVVASRRDLRMINYTGYYLALQAWGSLNNYMCNSGAQNESVRVALDPLNPVNLIPLDDLVDLIVRLGDSEIANGTVVNLVNENEVTIEQTFAAAAPYLDIQPVLCGRDGLEGKMKNLFEKLIGYSLTYAGPYMKDRIVIETGNLKKITGHSYGFDMNPDFLDALYGSYMPKLKDTKRPESALVNA